MVERQLTAMAQETHDLLVIGGGINGAAIAKDAALRGLKTALVEKEDFGYGTTSRSTRLIHGGLRYLELYDFGLVREGLREREILLRLAPHLVEPLPFLYPVYRGDRRGPCLVRLGMILYDLLAGRKRLPSHRYLSREAALAAEPLLNPAGLRAGMLYYDAQVPFPERMCVENALSAAAAGALLANHAQVVELVREGASVVGAVVQDCLTGEAYTIRAHVVVNATGPWAGFLQEAAVPAAPPRLRLTKGIHLLVPAFTRHAVVLTAREDDRVFFVIPWNGYSLVGTTDTDFRGDLDGAAATGADVAYLVRETQKVFPQADLSTIFYTTAGVRPLALAGAQSAAVHASGVSRQHAIVDHRVDGIAGLLTVLGGKITNHRLVAEETVNLASRRLGRRTRCVTRETPFYGGHLPHGVALFTATLSHRFRACGLSRSLLERLVRLYGSAAEAVLERAAAERELQEPIDPESEEIMAQVAYAVEAEMARSTADVLLRRTGVGLSSSQGVAAVEKVARFIGRRLGWDESAIRQDMDAYLRMVSLMREAWRKETPAPDTADG